MIGYRLINGTFGNKKSMCLTIMITETVDKPMFC